MLCFSMEATMSKSAKDTFGYLGTEPAALRDQLRELTAALEELAKAEGAAAVKASAEAVHEIAGKASELADKFADAGHVAAAAAGRGRGELETAIRDKPWVAVSLAAVAGFLLATLVRR